MIIHRHSDGSEGYQYQVGDEVFMDRTIHNTMGGIAIKLATEKGQRVVGKIVKERERSESWRIAKLYVKYSPDWGSSECFPWMVEPTEETRAAAIVVEVAA